MVQLCTFLAVGTSWRRPFHSRMSDQCLQLGASAVDPSHTAITSIHWWGWGCSSVLVELLRGLIFDQSCCSDWWSVQDVSGFSPGLRLCMGDCFNCDMS